MHLALVTCSTWPELSRSDALYAKALERLGAEVKAVPWNGAGYDDLAKYDAVILRSSWDYHDTLGPFKHWLNSVAERNIRLFNTCDQVLRFMDKRFLLDFQARGIVMGKMHAVACDRAAIIDVMRAEGWDKAVLKPIYGASSRGVELVERNDEGTAIKRVIDDVGPRDLLIQEFLPEIHSGEIQMVFFDGQFSHAIQRTPAKGEFRANSKYRPSIQPCVPEARIIQCAVSILAEAGPAPLYARVDGVTRNGKFLLNELELVEPDVLLNHTGLEAAVAFAEATLRRAS